MREKPKPPEDASPYLYDWSPPLGLKHHCRQVLRRHVASLLSFRKRGTV